VTRVVIDTSVYVSALIGKSGSSPDLVVRAVVDDRVEAIVSPALVRELESVLARPKFRPYVSPEQAREFVARVRRHTTEVADAAAEEGLTRDPDDDYIVALARDHGADAVVSLDLDLLDAGLTEPPVWTPRQFVDELTS
jgi:putative PIN family toxin of toxin-antitoxin system